MIYSAHSRGGLIHASEIGPYVDSGRLRRDVASGRLVRLRRGAYVDGAQWAAATPREQHLLRIRAVQADARAPIVVAGTSAAALWGMPLKGQLLADVTLLARWAGGGRSESGVRRSSVGHRSAKTVEIDGVMCTNLERTAIDIARQFSFADAVGSVDWALWRFNPASVTVDQLAEELARIDPRYGRTQVERVIAFATPLSDSYGESSARAVMHLLGFEAPELQVVFRDRQGEMRPDFFWRRASIVGEFDGKQKYTRDAFTRGDPGQVVWQEKKREDRLRRLSLSVTRILTADVENPQRLELLLTDAGVPRIARASL